MNILRNVTQIPSPCKLREFQVSREWVIASCLTDIQPVVRDVVTELKECSDLDAVELALHEALTNAIIHGNQESISKKVRLTLGQRRSGDVVLVVKDCGYGFDANKVPDPLGERLLYERGRGIFLMRHLVASVEFVYDNGTEVRLWLNPPDGAQGNRKRGPNDYRGSDGAYSQEDSRHPDSQPR
jgi:serine/threonine-protein kinase RsbW